MTAINFATSSMRGAGFNYADGTASLSTGIDMAKLYDDVKNSAVNIVPPISTTNAVNMTVTGAVDRRTKMKDLTGKSITLEERRSLAFAFIAGGNFGKTTDINDNAEATLVAFENFLKALPGLIQEDK